MESIEPTIGATVAAVWRHKLLALLVALPTFAAAIFVYLALTPMFQSSASLLIRQEQTTDSVISFMPTELMNSQVRIAESDEVVRAAVAAVGVENIARPEPGPFSGLGGRLRAQVREWRKVPAAVEPDAVLSDLDRALEKIRSAMNVRVEPNSSVITISVRDRNPVFAARMANALADSFIDQQNALSKRPGLVSFLSSQTRRFDEEAARRSAAMQAFMNDTRVYAIDEQRTLLLKRLSELDAATSRTRGELADKEGQKRSLARQLALLDPVTRSPFTLGFVQSLDQDGLAATLDDVSALPSIDRERAPPLLLIKVFQDAMAAYRIADAEIGGLRLLAEQQITESTVVAEELSRVTALQGEYDRLKREMELAIYNADTFARRTVEEQIEADLRDAKLSSVRVIQPAVRSTKAVSPKGVLFAAFGAVLGLTLGVAAALAKEMYDLNRRSAWRA